MARPPATIHAAYSVSRTQSGHTSYWAKAAVTDEGFAGWHSAYSGIGDSAAEALDLAIGYLMETYRRDGIPAPENTILYGRVRRDDIRNVTFIRRH